MKNIFCALFICLALATDLTQCQENSYTYKTEIAHWIHNEVRSLQPHQIQLLANLLLYSHRYAAIDSYMRQINHQLLLTTMQLHRNMLQSIIHNEVLVHMIDLVKKINLLAPYHQQAFKNWYACKEYVEQLDDQTLSHVFENLQKYAQEYTQHYVEKKQNNLSEHLKQATSTTAYSAQTLHIVSQILQNFPHSSDTLQSIDTLWTAQEQALTTIDYTLQDLLPIFDHIEKIQTKPCQFFKYCYAQLYDAFDDLQVSQEYRTQLFLENKDQLQNEQVPLPSAQHMVLGITNQ
jgi:hypothetical protein